MVRFIFPIHRLSAPSFTRRLERWYSIGALLTVWLLWLCMYWLWTAHHHNPLDEQMTRRLLVVEGTIEGLPTTTHQPSVQRFTFYARRIHCGLKQSSEEALRIRISYYFNDAPLALQAGESWRFVVRLKPPDGQAGPGVFNYENWLFEKNIDARGYVVSDHWPERLATAPWYDHHYWRQQLREHLNTHFEASRSRAVLKALMIGDRSEISDELWHLFRATGTSHLIAISGLHIGLIAMLLWYSGRWLWARFPRFCQALPAPLAGSYAASVGAFLYAAMAGFSIPTVRAFIMLMVFLAFTFVRRHCPPWFAWLLALIVVSSVNPRGIINPGFTLSFLAVAIIITALFDGSNRSWMKNAIRLQLLLSVLMIPAGVYFFSGFSLLSPVANLIAVPFIGWIVVPLTMASGASMFISDIFIKINLLLIDLFLIAAQWAATLPVSFVHIPAPSIASGIAASGLLWAAFFARKALSAALRLLLCTAAIIILLPWNSRPQEGQADIAVMDVGQGLAIAVATKNHTLIYDTGVPGMGERVIAPILRYKGWLPPDIIAISHTDSDHIGSLGWLHQRFPAARIVSIANCRGSWSWDDVFFTWLPVHGFSGNDLSCVLHISTHQDSLLLTGDIEMAAERQLIERYNLKSRWLVAPHHGSKTSSSPAFLRAVSAHTVIVSAGYLSRYGHPHSKVINRYRKHGMRMYSTACDGSIFFRLGSDDKMLPLRWRRERAAWWWRQCEPQCATCA